MLAHKGGFCMWSSVTTEYHTGNTSYKGGNGDVVRYFAEAYRKNNLNMGFYVGHFILQMKKKIQTLFLIQNWIK